MTKLEELQQRVSTLFGTIKTKLDSKLDKTAASVSALKLTSPFTLATTGDALGSVSLDGSANVQLALALKDLGITAGQTGSATVIPVITVDTKGRITAIASANLGNAPTSTKLATARTISITGAGTGSASFDGTANVAIALTLADSGVVAGKYTKLTVNAKGQVTLGEALVAADIPTLAISQIDSLQAALDGKLAVSGNAVSASKLATPRTLALTGDGTASMSVDGSQNVSAAFTLANTGVTAGTYAKVQVNAKGIVVAGSSLVAADIPNLDAGKITSGMLGIANGGTGASTVAAAKTNLQLDRFRQFSGTNDNGESQMGNGAATAYGFINNVSWGLYDPVNSKVLFGVNLKSGLVENGLVPVANGGTGATTAAAARTNLELDRIKQFPGNGETEIFTGDGNAYQYVNNTGWGLYDVTNKVTRVNFRLSDGVMDAGMIPVGNGGTGATTPAAARTNLGVKSMGIRDVFISTAAPTNSTGVDGDLWIQYV